jgi:hypothetical protein
VTRNPLSIQAFDHGTQQPMPISTVTKEYRTILPTLVYLIGMGQDVGYVLGSAAQLVNQPSASMVSPQRAHGTSPFGDKCHKA